LEDEESGRGRDEQGKETGQLFVHAEFGRLMLLPKRLHAMEELLRNLRETQIIKQFAEVGGKRRMGTHVDREEQVHESGTSDDNHLDVEGHRLVHAKKEINKNGNENELQKP